LSAEFSVLGIGNAIVDVLTHTDDAFLERQALPKGTMTLVDEERAETLYRLMEGTVKCSGGSAANTVVGVASLGGRGAYVGKVRDDELGRVFTEDIRSVGVSYELAAARTGPSTARCMIFVTPDAQRTMQTFLGASATLSPQDIDPDRVRRAGIVFLEGYLWDPPPAKAAFRRAAEIAHGAGRRVALTLSDPFCVERHRADFQALVAEHVDVLLANEHEALALWETADLDIAIDRLRAGRCRTAAITCSARGSIVLDGNARHDVPPFPVSRVMDTTGAGDLYAAGFLHGLAEGRPAEECGRLGSLVAAEVIGHFGARPEVRLADLATRHGLDRR
jgi:sugar/nucleoside kinase (ribokinase family)